MTYTGVWGILKFSQISDKTPGLSYPEAEVVEGTMKF
jgi:hypothetical protein